MLGADVHLRLPGEACRPCLGGLGKEARCEVASLPGALRRGPRPEWNDGRAGSLVALNSITGNLDVLPFADLLARRVTETTTSAPTGEPRCSTAFTIVVIAARNASLSTNGRQRRRPVAPSRDSWLRRAVSS
jgi:hypothetical protein